MGSPPRRLLPPFTIDGVLPPGDYNLTLQELASSYLIIGPRHRATTWDMAWRIHLMNNLGLMVDQLWRVGIDAVFINGSFVEDKGHPNDMGVFHLS